MSKAAQVKAPWLNSRDPEVPAALTYSELSMCSRVEEMVRRYPDYIAYEFMGKCTTYAEMWKKINACAKSLKAIGIREGDKVTICMPNAPQTLCMFYAVNMVGATLCPPRARSPSICGTPTPWRPSRWISSTPSLKASARPWTCRA